MSNVVKGKVDLVSQNKAQFWSIKVNGVFYGTGSKDKPEVMQGSQVEFQAEPVDYKGKTYYNVAKGTLKVGKAPAASGNTSNAQSGSGAVDWDLKDKKIQQQSARNAAIEFVSLLAAEKAVTYPTKQGVKEKDRLAVLETLLDHYTTKFLTATSNVGAPVAEEESQFAEESADGEDE